MPRQMWIALIGAAASAAIACGAAPRVVITSPDNGDDDVAADVAELRIEFDRPMDPRGRSIVGGGDTFPTITGQPRWLDERTMVVPVALAPSHDYRLSINSDTFRNFRGTDGEPAEWYPVAFRTRAAGAAPAAADVTVEQNRAAIEALRRAIDERYSYRDRIRVDWAAEIERRRGELEAAPTASAFARGVARLLRLAGDAHVSVEACGKRIGTRSIPASPNVDVGWLQKSVPHWTVRPGGLVTGRFDDSNVAYVLFSACTAAQADDFEAAFEQIKAARGVIVDLRANGGGDELAARRIASRFVARPAVYSRNRVRDNGAWHGPFDRVVEPAADRFAGPVVVLIGPKVMSSAESFALMMRHGAGAKLIGERTAGSSGNPRQVALGNGVTVHLSTWEDQTPDGRVLEGVGVGPDVMATTTPGELGTRDRPLEAALKALAAP